MMAQVSDDIEFRPDLFRGTAGYYDRFRVGYPQSLLEDIVRRAAVTGDGRLLDLACGTGQIAFALADVFPEVWAVDQEPDMISLVRDKAVAAGADHVNPVVSTAEDLAAPDGAFELVTVGNAFHRLRRETIASNIFALLQPGGCLALLWADSPWRGDRGWQIALSKILERWKTGARGTGRLRAGPRTPT